jgi:hypothetical protein
MLKKKYWGSHPWAKGYLAVTVGNVNSGGIQEYIENREVYHASGDLSNTRLVAFHIFNLLCKRLCDTIA